MHAHGEIDTNVRTINRKLAWSLEEYSVLWNKMGEKIINDGAEALTRKSQAPFQII